MSFLYVGTFGSFIGYSFAFGQVLTNQFGRTPLQAAYLTFIGPLLGSLIRPVGGWLADKYGGARITLCNYVGDGRGHRASWSTPAGQKSLPLFVVALRGAVRAQRARQRLDVQDDPGHLPGQGRAPRAWRARRPPPTGGGCPAPPWG